MDFFLAPAVGDAYLRGVLDQGGPPMRCTLLRYEDEATAAAVAVRLDTALAIARDLAAADPGGACGIGPVTIRRPDGSATHG